MFCYDCHSIPDTQEGASMSEKLSRAKHTHEAVQNRQAKLTPQHAKPSEVLLESEPFEPELESIDEQSCSKELNDQAYNKVEQKEEYSIGKSAALISICTIISRLTGFARTFMLAFSLGAFGIANVYNVAYNVPFMLSEIVAGGMIATAFLPVYLSVKKKLGTQASNAYASNILTISVILLSIVTVISICFPSAIIWTQNFISQIKDVDQAIFFFQFFAIQIVFYGISAVLSGLLNANRDFLWYSIAPIFTNLIHIGSFALYALIAPNNQELALYIVAIGNPAGVFIQIIVQMPALRKHGIKLRPRIDFKDPALKETLRLGVPAVIVVACSFIIVSVQQSAALSFMDDAGSSVLQFARLWFALPYSFLAIPIATTMFTELSNMQTDGNIEGFKRGIISGTNQILFFMLPFAFYLMLFSTPLISLYSVGAFTEDAVPIIASYLAALAFALPFYGVNTYMERVFASMRKMSVFALFNVVAAIVQIGLTLLAAVGMIPGATIESVAYATCAFYIFADVLLFAYLKVKLRPLKISSLAVTFIRSLLLGIVGSAGGWAVLWALETFIGPLGGSVLRSLAYIIAAGIVCLIITFGTALILKLPEASFLRSILSKVSRKFAK